MNIVTPMGAVRLRAETDEDLEFRFSLFRQSRAPEWDLVPEPTRSALMEHQFQIQNAAYRKEFAHARFDIIELNDARIGRIVVDRPGDMVHIVDQAIVPQLRGRGIGGEIMKSLMAEAGAAHLPVCLNVASSNVASMRLYERLGFVTIASDPMYRDMEWKSR